jgi:hypothetical protein
VFTCSKSNTPRLKIPLPGNNQKSSANDCGGLL